MVRRFRVVLLLAATVFVLPSSSRQKSLHAAATVSLVDALEAYGDGRTLRIEFKTIEDLRYALNRSGRAWAESGPVDDRRRRRNVVALFALDAVLNPLAAVLSNWR